LVRADRTDATDWLEHARCRALEEYVGFVDRITLEKRMDLRALEQAVGKDKDIAYWNPRRLGDVFYNFWD